MKKHLGLKLGDLTCKDMPENCKGCPFATRDLKLCMAFNSNTKFVDGLNKIITNVSPTVYYNIKAALNKEV